MNKTQNNITLPASRKRRRGSWTAAALTLLTACGFATGCASQNNPPPAAKPASGTTTALTPEQEAAKQRAIQTGMAFQAHRAAAEAAAKAAPSGQ